MSCKYVDQYRDFYRGKMPTEVPGYKPCECEHVWDRWEDFEDGNGGTLVCSKCGKTAICFTLEYDEPEDTPNA